MNEATAPGSPWDGGPSNSTPGNGVKAGGLRSIELPMGASDGHRWTLQTRIPQAPTASLLWMPALGVAARHYLPFAEALARRGVAVFIHEWRGNGSSSLRATRRVNWGYRELLSLDLPASEAAMAETLPGLPRIAGGHSLGGQLAALRIGMAADPAQRLWLVASGAPYWRTFPSPLRHGLSLAYRFLPWLGQARGMLPGRLVGFGGNEARGLISDWARTARTGRYAVAQMNVDLEASLAKAEVHVNAVRLADDWLVPEASLRYLLAKMPCSPAAVVTLDAHAAGTEADHFAWMKAPEPVAAALLAG